MTRAARQPVPDLLAHAASPEMQRIWSAESLVRLERRLWLAVMRGQMELGLAVITPEAIAAYEAVADHVDLESIRRRELVTKHDVKARIEEFSELAGHQVAHVGMTSADAVENCYLIRMRDSVELLGLQDRAGTIPFRGLKGAVGTFQDQLDLLGSYEACQRLDQVVAHEFGFTDLSVCVPQVMHRSIDLQVISTVAGAYPHPFTAGFLDMVVGYQGDTWNEGDVSSSAVRRIAIPGAFFAADWVRLGCRSL